MLNTELKLKVCGLTQISQAEALTNEDIDFLGFIFYNKSPRFVLHHLSTDDIKGIKHPAKVGVFVNETTESIIQTADSAGLNLVQLHGDETLETVERLKNLSHNKFKIIKAFRISGTSLPVNLDEFENVADYFLFDTDTKAFGGSGETFNWEILNQLNMNIPFFLSGGISSENAAEINKLKKKPFALDINSKFEKSPGIKDFEKIKNFHSKIIKNEL